jgi:RND family efflux transporter MFP subunit
LMMLLASALAGPANAQECSLAIASGFTEPAATVEVAAREPGIVATMHVEVGQKVKGGDVLAELDKTMARAEVDGARVRFVAKGRLMVAEAKRDLARRKMSELEKLEKARAVRPLEMIEARAELLVAEAEVEAMLEERRAAEIALASAEARLSLLDIRAPFDGVVSTLHRKPSELVGAGGDARLVTLLSLDKLHADFFVPPACLGRAETGTPLQIRLPREGREVAARVRDLGPDIDAPTGLRRLGIEVDNGDYQLLSGERVELALPLLAPVQ